MNGYEKLAKLFQQQSSSTAYILFTTMITNSSCKVNDLLLDSDDLLIAEHLQSGWYIQKGDEMLFVNPIKAGDTVIVVKLNDEKYAIIERLVNI
jgi:hypothetical protein